MDRFRDEGFVLNDVLENRWERADRLVIAGRIRCQHGVFVDVRQVFSVRRDRGKVQGRMIAYRYHAGIEGAQARSILRYDNAHSYAREGHPDTHHKHRFDHTTWQEATPPEWIGADRWPHLSDVIEKMRGWWETTGKHLELET